MIDHAPISALFPEWSWGVLLSTLPQQFSRAGSIGLSSRLHPGRCGLLSWLILTMGLMELAGTGGLLSGQTESRDRLGGDGILFWGLGLRRISP